MGLLDAVRKALAPPPPAPPWLTEQELGAISAWCLTRDAEWINRRVERIELVDDETIRRQVSVDFSLPQWLAPEGATVYVPLAILRRQPLTNFDVRQEDGATMSVRNSERSGAISTWALKDLARREVEADELEVHDRARLDELLEAVASSPAPAARAAFADLERGYPALMVAGSYVRTTSEALADGFQLLVPVEMKSNATRVIKFRYDEAIDWRGHNLGSRVFALVFRGLWELIGWMPKRWDLLLQDLDRGQGYHLEVVAPEELDIFDAVIKRKDGGRRRLTIAEGGGKERVHLMPAREHRRGESRLTVKLRPQRGGVMLACAATATLAAGELLLGRPHVREIEPQTGAALLLLLPSLLAAFLIRPGEHTFASRMLGGVRLITAAAALWTLCAAGALAIYGSSPPTEGADAMATRLDRLEHVWELATWIVCGCASVLLAAYILGGRYPSILARWVARKLRRRPE